MKHLTIVYDDWCPYCTRFSNFIKKNDLFNNVSFLRLRKDDIKIDGFNKEEALKKMASFEKEWKYGYDSILRLSVRIPTLWILIPILYLLKVIGIGDSIYNELAIKRKIIPIHCNDNCTVNF